MRGFLPAALLSPVVALALVAPAGATVPVNSTPPSIESDPPGTAYVGGGLADAGGSWSATPAPGTSIAVQWLRCDADGQACVPIPGATTTNYELVLADVGHTIRVQETGSNGPDVSAPVVSAPSVVVRTLPVGVNYTRQPVISGRPVIGETLRVSDGVWTGTPPITFSYQWQRCGGVLNPGGQSSTIVCVDIPGATQNTYTVTTADAGKLMLAYVMGTNSVSSYRLHASAYTLPVPEPPKTISDALEAVLDLAPGVSHTVSAAELLAAGGYRTSFRALKPGHLTIEWTTQIKHRTVRVAFARRTFRQRGTYPVKIGLTRKGRALLRADHRLRMRLVASYEGHKVTQAVVEQRNGRFRYVAP
jgi:hypothetical protein